MKRSSVLSLVLLSGLLSFTSFHFEKSLTVYGLFLYPVIVFAVLRLLVGNLDPLLRTVDRAQPRVLFSLFLLLIIGAYSLWYPYEDRRGIGTDRDEGLNQGVTELLHGHYPYYIRSVVTGKAHEQGLDNNPLLVMPGSILFSVPFVLLGNSAYQNFFWLAALYLFLARRFHSYGSSLIVIVTAMFLCGTFIFQVLIGSDFIANSIWVILLTSLAMEHSDRLNAESILRSLLLGIGLSSRMNFLLILIPMMFVIARRTTPRHSLVHTVAALTGWSLVTVPFYLYDSGAFAPLHQSNLFAWYDRIIPYSSVLFPLLTVCLSLFVSYRFAGKSSSLFSVISVILLFPVLVMIVLESVSKGTVTFSLSHYAFASFLFYYIAVFDRSLNPGTVFRK